MTLERRIEGVLDSYLKGEGWQLDSLDGDHFAAWTKVNDEDDEDDDPVIVINITECAKAIVAELTPCS